MAINQINTTIEEQNFKFLPNESSILHTIKTNNITINGINIIVEKPKRGDIMCITRYEEDGVLLDADKQTVVWIDGLSIDPKYLSEEYEPVGICISANSKKALVRYKTERDGLRFAASERWELPNSSIMTDGAEHTLQVTLNGKVNDNPLILTAEDTTSRKAFVDKLNAWFWANDTNYCAELVELNTDLPAIDTSDTKDGNSYRNRIIVNVIFKDNYYSNSQPINIEEIGSGICATAKHVKGVNLYYLNNGKYFYAYNNLRSGIYGGCCRAGYYDFIQTNQHAPTKQMTSINVVPGGIGSGDYPARLIDFNDNKYCQILRDNFSSYDEYLELYMIKCPCGIGVIGQGPSGKENTYKLSGCLYQTGPFVYPNILYSSLYPAVNYAASISLNAPNLGEGNWWLPSAAEMIEMMRDITYGTSLWDTKPDIVNRVLTKLNSFDSSWSMLDASIYRWTSSEFHTNYFYYYDGSEFSGILGKEHVSDIYYTTPITIYEL